MTTDFDLTLLPLYRLDGRELAAPPGLLVIMPPRKPARGRERDRLLVHLTLVGNAPASTANYMQLTARTAESFYETAGSLTAAMRTAAETLNAELLGRNLSTSGQSLYAFGYLTLGALRRDEFYFLQAGPTHIFTMTDGAPEQTHDPQLAGRGLGISQNTKHYLSRKRVAPAGRLLLAGKLPTEWEILLKRDVGISSLEAIRRRLISQTADNLNAVLIETQSGQGRIVLQKPPRQKLEEPQIEFEPVETLPPALEEPKEETLAATEETPPPAPSAYAIPPSKEPKISLPTEQDTSEFPASIPRAPSLPVDDWIPIEEESVPPLGEVVARQTARTLADGMQAARKTNAKVSQGIRTMLPKLLPGSDPNASVNLPNWTMALIAIIIPLIVVTVASVVYFQSGGNLQYQDAFSEAQTARARAIQQTDELAKRLAWENTLFSLDKAEKFRTTAETREMRAEALDSLDILLDIIRLDFSHSISGVPRNAQITRIVATDTEIYMLNASNGGILRAFLTGKGYQVDESFQCAPGEYNAYTVGKMVDLQLLPKVNAKESSVMGVDATGNLLYCAPNQVAQPERLPTPNLAWGEITAMVLDSELLYILDANTRSIWVYTGKLSWFDTLPNYYFSEYIPKNLEDAIDMTINGDDLYLLHADGHLVTCEYSRLTSVPTRCTDPAQLIDPHPAAGGGNVFEQVRFSEIMLTSPPDSAILLLDGNAQAVFRLSPRSLQLNHQLRVLDEDLPKIDFTALAMTPGHVLFLAQGNQVYFAMDVP